MLTSDSWRIIETILKRYPRRKKEYQEYLDEVMSRNTDARKTDFSENYTKPQSVTEAAALKMTSLYADKVKKEIIAVEAAFNSLRQEEQKVIRARYWTGSKKPVPYLLLDTGFSERQMKRIVYKTFVKIGKMMGEIK